MENSKDQIVYGILSLTQNNQTAVSHKYSGIFLNCLKGEKCECIPLFILQTKTAGNRQDTLVHNKKSDLLF